MSDITMTNADELASTLESKSEIMYDNANLRAAAPDMYEALDELLKYLSFRRPLRSDIQYSFLHPEDLEKALDKAKLALAKAKGTGI